jgi:hypothetical protein
MPGETAAMLAILGDIQSDVRDLMITTRRAWSDPDLVEDRAKVLLVVEDRLFVLGVTLELFRTDIKEAGAKVDALGEHLEEQLAECAALMRKVLARENALRIQTAVRENFRAEDVLVDQAAGVTVVVGAPLNSAPDHPVSSNIIAFPDAVTRAVWRLGRDPSAGGSL